MTATTPKKTRNQSRRTGVRRALQRLACALFCAGQPCEEEYLHIDRQDSMRLRTGQEPIYRRILYRRCTNCGAYWIGGPDEGEAG